MKRTLENGFQVWYLNSNYHREDGPAITSPDGYQVWFVYGQRHRLDGPAWISPDGRQSRWYVNGIQITNEYDLSLFDSDEGRMILLIKYGNPEY